MNEKEYLARVAGLYDQVRAEAAIEDESVLLERYRDAEFDLTIEYRLGPDFPPERWQALREINRQTREKSEALKTKYLSKTISKDDFAAEMQRATTAMAKAFKSVLTPEEHAALFESEEGGFGLALEPEAL